VRERASGSVRECSIKSVGKCLLKRNRESSSGIIAGVVLTTRRTSDESVRERARVRRQIQYAPEGND
jgi:hypothetical protein